MHAFKYPSKLAVAPVDEAKVLSEFLSAYRFSQASPADNFAMVVAMFEKVLVATPLLARLNGNPGPLQAYHAFCPLLKAFEITSGPLLSDWQTLDGRIKGMLEIVASMPPTTDLLGKRVNLIIKDEKATHRVYTSKLDMAKTPGKVGGSTAAIGPTSIMLLCCFAKLQAMVQKLSQEMARSKPRCSIMINTCL